MSAIKTIIQKLAKKGELTHDITIQDTKFVLRTISSEEQFLVETISSISNLKEKYDAKGEISSYSDTLNKMRNVALLAFVIKSIDGVDVVDEGLTNSELFKQRLEVRDEIAALPTPYIDALLNGYRELAKMNKELYENAKETLGK